MLEESIVENYAESQEKEVHDLMPTCVVTRSRSRKHAEESAVQKDMDVETAFTPDRTFMDQVGDEVAASKVSDGRGPEEKSDSQSEKWSLSRERDLYRNNCRMWSYKG